MADISVYLAQILSAVYGKDVRGSIHDAIEIINDVSEVILSTGTAVDSSSSSSTGFYDDSLYLNTDTYELWKCVGVDTWQSLGTLKGADGSPGVPGEDGNKWYRGTGISGKAVNPTVYSGSGITEANPNDFYLNPSEGAVYHCVTGGDASTATWSYDFTMTGGGGGGSVVGWNQIQTSTGATKIAEITIDGSKQDVYAPQGGGGSSTFAGLSDVSLDGTPTADQIVQYKNVGGSLKLRNVNMPQGGHNMLDNSTIIAGINSSISEGTSNDDVVSGYGVGTWSNLDGFKVLVQVSTGTDTIGTWEDDATWETGSRIGWIWHASLYGVLGDDDYDIEPSFKLMPSKQNAIACLQYRIDDDVTLNGVHGGAFAMKLCAPIPAEQNNAKVGLTIKRNRTNVYNGTAISS